MPENEVTAPVLVETAESLEDLLSVLRGHRQIAVDTESNSLHAYRERVCLLQFSTPEQDYIVDPLALDELGSLGPIFEDPQIEKIFHAAEYDILCLRRDFGFEFARIFDTMQAGRILGRKMAGLDRLLEEKFGVRVSKRFQKANWATRPLSPQLQQYAALDTHYLIRLRELLEAELRERGLTELAQEDFRMACNHRQLEAAQPGESPSWARFRGRRDIKPGERAILKELLAWRETVAGHLDRPPFKVMSDDRLLGVARAGPKDAAGLTAAGLTPRQVQQWGVDLLKAIGRGLQAPPIPLERRASPDPTYLKRLENLKDWRKKAAAGMQVESDVVLPRGLMLALAEGGASQLSSVMQPSPWRLQRFGAELAEVLGAASGADN